MGYFSVKESQILKIIVIHDLTELYKKDLFNQSIDMR